MPKPTQVLIVGGGLSGLTAAWTLASQGVQVTLLEASNRLGGVIQTVWESGYLTESGPNTFPSSATAFVDLCHQLGLSPQPTDPIAKNRYLYLNDTLTRVPLDPLSFFFSELLSWDARIHLLMECLYSKTPPFQVETLTVADFFRRRFGQEILEHLVTPALSGIYAGDPSQMSMAATMSRVMTFEQTAGSVTMGMLKAAFNQSSASKAGKSRYQLLGLENGLQMVVDKMAEALPKGSICLNTHVTRLIMSAEGLSAILSNGQQFSGGPILLATPAGTTAELLQTLSPRLGQGLSSIPYAPMAVVHLGFPKEKFQAPLKGFGCLVPRGQGVNLLGAIWTSSLFPHRAPANHHLLSCYVGGDLEAQQLMCDDATLIRQTEADLSRLFKQPMVSATYSRLVRYPHAIPQYRPGHRPLIQQAESQLAAYPGLHLCGNYLAGVSLNDCVRSAQTVCQRILSDP